MKLKRPSVKELAHTEYLGHFSQDRFIQQGHNDSGTFELPSEVGTTLTPNTMNALYEAQLKLGALAAEPEVQGKTFRELVQAEEKKRLINPKSVQVMEKKPPNESESWGVTKLFKDTNLPAKMYINPEQRKSFFGPGLELASKKSTLEHEYEHLSEYQRNPEAVFKNEELLNKLNIPDIEKILKYHFIGRPVDAPFTYEGARAIERVLNRLPDIQKGDMFTKGYRKLGEQEE